MKKIFGRFKRTGGEVVTEAQYLENPYADEIPRWAREWRVQELRFVANPITKTLYIFPNWLLHSDFLSKHLNLSYEDVMDKTDIYFGLIQITQGGIPYAVIESSQFDLLASNLKTTKRKESLLKAVAYLEQTYSWMRLYGIEPIAVLAKPYLASS
jgi:hypothetical protein